MGDTAHRLLPEKEQDDPLSVRHRSKLNFMLISSFFLVKVPVVELLEHRIAKRASFIGLP